MLSAIGAKLTDVSLPEKVGLTFGCVSTRESPINLVFDVTHGDEGRDNTAPSTRLH